MRKEFGMFNEKRIDDAIRRWRMHARSFEKRFLGQGRLPKAKDWRPHRFATRDVILGLNAIRHNIKDNLLEVDVCISTDPPQFPEYTGARISAIALLSEAFNCGSSMEIKFTRNWGKTTVRVPFEIYDLAFELGVNLNHVSDGHITPKEARRLYLALTPISEESVSLVKKLAVEDKISAERVCFMVHNKIWEPEEMDSILLGSTLPHRILLGTSLPEQGLMYASDLTHARNAVLGGFLDRKVKSRERVTEEGSVELEADERRVNIGFEPSVYAKVYFSKERIPIPWTGSEQDLPVGNIMYVLVRARDSNDLMLNFADDLKAAEKLVQNGRKKQRCFILVPRDFENTEESWRKPMRKKVSEANIGLMVCPENAASLDRDAVMRLRKSRLIRQ